MSLDSTHAAVRFRRIMFSQLIHRIPTVRTMPGGRSPESAQGEPRRPFGLNHRPLGQCHATFWNARTPLIRQAAEVIIASMMYWDKGARGLIALGPCGLHTALSTLQNYERR